ncbi:Uncharacterised protein [Rothia kristinae]|nr:Uncharacterised protein [Rothia kristinae]
MRLRTIATQPLRNPLILGSAAGIIVNLLGLPVPDVVHEPLRLLGGPASR